MLPKLIREINDNLTTEPSPSVKKFNAVCSVAGGLFLCFWGGLLMVLLGPSLISITDLGTVELLYVAACLTVCVIVFVVGATLILQSKTPRFIKRCFYGFLSLPAILFGIWIGWAMIAQNGFNSITLAVPVACTVVGVNWARLAVRGDSGKLSNKPTKRQITMR